MSGRTGFWISCTDLTSCLASVLLLSVASECDSLREYVTDIDGLTSKALNVLSIYKAQDSSVEFAYEIVSSLRRRQRICT